MANNVTIPDASGTSRTVKTTDTASVHTPHHNIDVVKKGLDYETVAASQTDQALGATGAAGDYLEGLLVVPATTGAGNISIKDGAGSAISVFATGTLSNLVPFFIPLGIISGSGAWKVTTGANVSVVATGKFT